ncbi:helix-turn-helix domain-containing protein [Limimaricola pyoseonensis]|uniref:Transcriptional regulator, ArsR family n=1 Tax=Limimaricola pyoseonensis TaxID=521013 RepID=A0A1G7AZ12_9RHOB|nr:helix-turn-helix domain-containing protein [Limimaricola pyoseonensis]SDE20128.1 transcriptional regulator, ArsR family [Limimaricola pyoseonensis]
MESNAVESLAVLAHPQRLALFRLLMRRYPDAVPAGEIAGMLEVRANTLSAYLSALRQAGLIAQLRQGRSLLYRADMERAGGLLSYLIEDCCRSRPALRPAQLDPTAARGFAMTRRPYNVLFICTGNSARSIFAEAILRDIGGERFRAFSAGTSPRSELNPMALQVLEANGHDTASLRAKTVEEFRGAEAPALDFVFTVCDRAANEECPAWPGQPISGHWGQPDPVKATGTGPERQLAFHQVYGALRRRIELFTTLDFAALDRIAIQRAVDGLTTGKDPQ